MGPTWRPFLAILRPFQGYVGAKLAPSWPQVGLSWLQVGPRVGHASHLGAILASRHLPKTPSEPPGTLQGPQGPTQDPPGTSPGPSQRPRLPPSYASNSQHILTNSSSSSKFKKYQQILIIPANPANRSNPCKLIYANWVTNRLVEFQLSLCSNDVTQITSLFACCHLSFEAALSVSPLGQVLMAYGS